MPPRLLSILCALVAIAFGATIVWAGMEKGLGAGFSAVLAERWGLVALADLYLGFAVLSGWIAAVERSRLRAAAWIVAVFLLGNFISLVYLSIRAWGAKDLREVFLLR